MRGSRIPRPGEVKCRERHPGQTFQGWELQRYLEWPCRVDPTDDASERRTSYAGFRRSLAQWKGFRARKVFQ